MTTATATKKTQRMSAIDQLYESHLRREGRDPWNDNPDGCYFCGSSHHHSDDCPDRFDYREFGGDS